MGEFLSGAFPWVLTGLVLAVVIVFLTYKQKEK